MSGLYMALLAEPGHRRFEQLRTAGTMGFMAIHAILHDRRVLPQERPTPLRMALVTSLVDRAFGHELGIGSSMRVMAIRASNFSFSKRHVSRTLHLSTPQRMALKADLHFRVFDELTISSQRL